ncbi:MAG: hypothetical protein GY760_17125 [Deltaproteobacteria bacterium]|nr:hypothetical protein [Deltaproteobacteria bacterium]
MKKIIPFIILLQLFIVYPFSISAQDLPRSIHVLVALCDNINQGIVPVPASLGNGQNPRQNLYWGALYGVKTYFKKASEWKLIKTIKNPNQHILERCIFKKTGSNIFLVADAYDGARIVNTITDLIKSSNGSLGATININNHKIGIYGNSNLLAYIGHNGLMDFKLPSLKLQKSGTSKDIIVLACKSRSYFEPIIQKTGANPLLLTKGFMAPEAYTLKAAIDGWALNEKNEEIRLRAAKAYQKYQKISFKGANSIFYTYNQSL